MLMVDGCDLTGTGTLHVSELWHHCHFTSPAAGKLRIVQHSGARLPGCRRILGVKRVFITYTDKSKCFRHLLFACHAMITEYWHQQQAVIGAGCSYHQVLFQYSLEVAMISWEQR